MKNEQNRWAPESTGSVWRTAAQRPVRWVAATVGASAVLAVVVGAALALSAQPRVLDARLDDILNRPDQYVGQEVAVSGVVEETLTHRALTLSGESSKRTLLAMVTDVALVTASDGAGDGGLTGFVPQLHGPLYRDGAVVRLTGKVERLDAASLASQLNVVLNPALFGSYEDQPVLVVTGLDINSLVGIPSLGAPSPGG